MGILSNGLQYVLTELKSNLIICFFHILLFKLIINIPRNWVDISLFLLALYYISFCSKTFRFTTCWVFVNSFYWTGVTNYAAFEGGIPLEYLTKGASDILLTYKIIKYEINGIPSVVLIQRIPSEYLIKYHHKHDQHKAEK